MKKYDFKGEEGLEIVSLQKLTQNSFEIIGEPPRISFYQVYHFTAGTTGILEINFEEIPLQPGSILFVPSDVVCSFSSESLIVKGRAFLQQASNAVS
ncbi:MAG: AraC family ligand binding domain-containing protein [Saprospiraceae bacterium]|nr:AraC family ligand binding domain-containing protein [Saprospiraceae bacterium]